MSKMWNVDGLGWNMNKTIPNNACLLHWTGEYKHWLDNGYHKNEAYDGRVFDSVEEEEECVGKILRYVDEDDDDDEELHDDEEELVPITTRQKKTSIQPYVNNKSLPSILFLSEHPEFGSSNMRGTQFIDHWKGKNKNNKSSNDDLVVLAKQQVVSCHDDHDQTAAKTKLSKSQSIIL